MTRMRKAAIKPLTDHSLGRLRLAPSIFSVPHKDLSHDFSSQVALESSYHAPKHFFSIRPFLLHFSTSYLFQIWSVFRMSHPSMSLSKGLPHSSRLHRFCVYELQLRFYPS